MQHDYTNTMKALRHSLLTASGDPRPNSWDDAKLDPERVSHRLEAAYVDGMADPGDALVPTGNERLDRILRNAGVRVLYGDAPSNAYPTTDTHQIAGHDYLTFPNREAFRSPADYRATMAHELTHWAGAIGRLSRKAEGVTKAGQFLMSFMGPPPGYVLEEMTAEIGAALLLEAIGEDPNIEARAAYVQNWYSAFRGTDAERAEMLRTAEAQAQQSVDYLLQYADA